ncbi:MAG TPA: DUF2730 family protein [Thiolapillus brandeum]|uniref:DUF2730 family protein n=1 Tax=Thiolapillus brandeum TaxID=1076588 RepID=A0A7C5N7F2_9GAMM|nr:DUF2730 family protein [Thiolapillus brandeum]
MADYRMLGFWWDVAQAGGLAVVAAYTWLANRSKANRAAIDRVDGRVGEMAGRLERLEQRADTAPTHSDLSVLHERITELSGAVRELTGVMQQLRRAVDRVETYLLEKGGE